MFRVFFFSLPSNIVEENRLSKLETKNAPLFHLFFDDTLVKHLYDEILEE